MLEGGGLAKSEPISLLALHRRSHKAKAKRVTVDVGVRRLPRGAARVFYLSMWSRRKQLTEERIIESADDNSSAADLFDAKTVSFEGILSSELESRLWLVCRAYQRSRRDRPIKPVGICVVDLSSALRDGLVDGSNAFSDAIATLRPLTTSPSSLIAEEEDSKLLPGEDRTRVEFLIKGRRDAPISPEDAARIHVPGGLKDASTYLARHKPKDYLYVTLDSLVLPQQMKPGTEIIVEISLSPSSPEGSRQGERVDRGGREYSSPSVANNSSGGCNFSWQETVRLEIPDDDPRNYRLHYTLYSLRLPKTTTPQQQQQRVPLAAASMPLAAELKKNKSTPLILLAPMAFVADGERRLTCTKIDDDENNNADQRKSLSLFRGSSGSSFRNNKDDDAQPFLMPNSTTSSPVQTTPTNQSTDKDILLVVSTYAVSERRPPAEYPELLSLMHWRNVEAGDATAAVIEAATFSAVFGLDLSSSKSSKRGKLWPSRLFLRAFLKPLLAIFVENRSNREQLAAYAALASIFAHFNLSNRREHLNSALVRALAADYDGVLPVTKRKRLNNKTAEDTWLPSSVEGNNGIVIASPTPAPTKDSSQNAEESWALFLAKAAKGAFDLPDVDENNQNASLPPPPPETPKTFKSQKLQLPATDGRLSFRKKAASVVNDHRSGTASANTSPAKKSNATKRILHLSLLEEIARQLERADADTVAALDALMTIVCASFAKAGGSALEGDQDCTLTLVDRVVELTCKALATTENHTSQGQCVATLAGTFQSLLACFPLGVVSNRVVDVVASLRGDSSHAAIELEFLISLARAPVLRASTDAAARLVLSKTLSRHASVLLLKGAAPFVKGLAAQVIGELVSVALVARDSETAIAVSTALLPKLLECAAGNFAGPQHFQGSGNDPSLPLQRNAASKRIRSTKLSTNLDSDQMRKAPHYWELNFCAEGDSKREALRPSAALDAAQDLAATCLSLLRVVPSLRDAGVLDRAVDVCGKLSEPFDAENWPLLSACAWSICSRVLAEAAREAAVSSSSLSMDAFFDLGLGVLESPDTDVASMSDTRLAYLIENGAEALVDLRPSTVECLDVFWQPLDARTRFGLSSVILSRAIRLLAKYGGAVSALAASLVADIVVADVAVNGDLANLERCLVDVLDDLNGKESTPGRIGTAFETTIPKLISNRITACDESWRPVLSRATELHEELEKIARPSSYTNIELACSRRRIIAIDGPLLQPNVRGERCESWERRAARRARQLAGLMAGEESRVEAGVALLRAAQLHDGIAEEDEDMQQLVSNLPAQLNKSGDGVDEAIRSRLGPTAFRAAQTRRVASRLFEAALPPAWELSLACSEVAIAELRSGKSAAPLSHELSKKTREALAVEHRRVAGYYALLDARHEPRKPCVVFRCRFDWSEKLPTSLRGREFACRGDPDEQLGDFVDRLRSDVCAELVVAPSNIDFEQNGPGAIATPPRIQTSTLVPSPAPPADDDVPFLTDAFNVADVSAPWRPSLQWAHEWPVVIGNANATSALDVWVDRRVVTLEEQMPAPTRWVPVVQSTTQRLNPFEVAFRQLASKNDELRQVFSELLESPDAGAQQRHTMAINGVVDAAVNGGLANWKPLATGSYKISHPEIQDDINAHQTTKADLADRFQTELEDHLDLVAKCVRIHRDKCPASMRPLAAHIESTSWPKLKAECEAIKRQADIVAALNE